MKRFEILFLSLILSIATAVPSTQGDSNNTCPTSGPMNVPSQLPAARYTLRWQQIKPEHVENGLYIEVPAGSFLLVKNIFDINKLKVFDVFYTGNDITVSQALIPLIPVETTKMSMIFAGEPEKRCTRMVQYDGETADLRFFVSVKWWGSGPDPADPLADGIDGIERERRIARKLLDQEDIWSCSRPLKGTPKVLNNSKGYICTTKQSLTIQGPACLLLGFRLANPRAVETSRHSTELSVTLDMDSIPLPPPVKLSTHKIMLSGSTGQPEEWGAMIRRIVYIPSGWHTFSFRPRTTIWASVSLRKPFHLSTRQWNAKASQGKNMTEFLDHKTIQALCTYGLNTIPKQNLYDIHQLIEWVSREPDNSIALICLQNQRNRIHWSPIELSGNRQLLLDPPGKISRSRPSGTITEATDAGIRYCILETGVSYPVNIPDNSNISVETNIVRFFDLSNPRRNTPPLLLVDGQLRYQPDWFNPAGSPETLNLHLPSGHHTIRLASRQHRLLTDIDIPGAHTIKGYIRRYYHLPAESDPPLTFNIKSKYKKTLLRFLWHPESQSETKTSIMISVDDEPPFEVLCHCNANDTFPVGFEWYAPSERTIKIWSRSGHGLINIAIADILQTNVQPECHPSPWFESLLLNQYFSSSGQQKEAPSSPMEKILFAADSGNISTAYKLFLNRQDKNDSFTGKFLYFYLLARSGQPVKASLEGLAIEKTCQQTPDWFRKLLLKELLKIGWTDKAVSLAEILYREHPDDIDITLTTACLRVARGDLTGAEVIVKRMDPEKLKNNGRYRRLILALSHSASPEKARNLTLQDDWAVSSVFPVFRSVKSGTWDGSFIPLYLENTLFAKETYSDFNTSAEILTKTNYAGLSTGDTLKVPVTGPTILRWVVRPVSEQSSKSIFNTTVAINAGNGKNLIIPINHVRPARINLMFQNHPDIRPGEKKVIDIPVPNGKTVITIKCISGACAVKPMVQVPGYMDFPGPSPDDALYETIQHLIQTTFTANTSGSLNHRSLSYTTAFAQLKTLEQHFPDTGILNTWLSLLKQFMKTRVVPIPGSTPVYLRCSNSDDTGQPIPGIFSGNTPSLRETALTGNSSLYYIIPSDTDGEIDCRISAESRESPDFEIYLLSGGTLWGILDNDHRQWTGRLPKTTASKHILRVKCTDPGEKDIIKISILFRPDGKPFQPLHPVRRYARINPGIPQTVHINGPTVLNIFYRALHDQEKTDNGILKIHLEDPGGAVLLTSKIPFDQTHPFTDTDHTIQIPIVDSGLHTLVFNTSESPVAVRLTGFVWFGESLSESGPTSSSGNLFKNVSVKIPDRSNFSSKHSKSEESISDLLSGKRPILPSPGTWTVSAGYRHRSNDTDDDGWDLFDTDGGFASIGYRRRFDPSTIYYNGRLEATQPVSDNTNPVFYTRHDLDFPLYFLNLRCHSSIRLASQRLAGETASRWYIRMTVFRSFKPAPRWHLIPSVSFFDGKQSLSGTDVENLPDPPDPRIYTGFNRRHEAGGALQFRVRYDLNRRLFFYTQFRAITAGDDETGVWGPWWWISGLKWVTGFFEWHLSYMERRSFGSSMEPDRSRLKAAVQFYRWGNQNVLFHAGLEDRFTLETNRNTVQLTLTWHINRGRFLRDFNPFRNAFIREIERISP